MPSNTPIPASIDSTGTAIQEIARGLTMADWICRMDFLPPDRIEALRHEAEGLRKRGAFRAAGIGHYAERHDDVRGDEILWLDESEQAPEAARLLREEFGMLQATINAETYLGLDEFEGHYAVYPAGAGYARHLDRFREENRRVVSLVLYLNETWEQDDGGELCLYGSADAASPVARISPQTGTLVCFLSEGVPHEVLAARRTRFSLTGWFRRRA